jgi:predicted transcriptional regulator
MTIEITPAIAARLHELATEHDESAETIACRVLAQNIISDDELDAAFDEIDVRMLKARKPPDPTRRRAG